MSSMKAKTITSTGLLALFAAITPSVNGHGYPNYVQEGSNTYLGLQSDWQKPDNTPVLVSDYLTPTYNVESPNIACGINPKAPGRLAEVSPGSTLNWRWLTHAPETGQYKSWTHNEGTHRAFIGACIGSCMTTDPTQVEWVELGSQYVGQQTWDGNRWPVADLAAGNTWAVRVPDVPAGDYLIRDELTALHFSTERYHDFDAGIGHGSGTEFYPACIAVHVNNNGGGSLDMNQVMKFPGAYSHDVPGHYNPDLWSNPGSVVISAVNTFTRSGGSPPNSGGSGGGNNDNGGNGGNSGGDNGGNGTTTPGNGSSNPGTPQGGCSARRKKRSAKFRRAHHARSH